MKITLQFGQDGNCWILNKKGNWINWIHPTQLAEVILGEEVNITSIIDIYTGEAEVMQAADIPNSKLGS